MNIAQKLMDHRFAGLCPDALDGWDRRDPECAACRALDALAEQGEEWEYAWASASGEHVWPYSDRDDEAGETLEAVQAVTREEWWPHESEPGDQIVRRTKAIPAGPWIPVPTEESAQPASTPGVENQAPNHPISASDE